MFYYLYQITNLVNAKIYVGVHKTQDFNDGYMGSGKVILAAIKKHGIENFKKDIFEQFADAKSMYAREKEVVNESFLSRKDVYNLRRGGHGGFDHINRTGKNIKFGANNPLFRNPNNVLAAKKGGTATVDAKVGIHDTTNISVILGRRLGAAKGCEAARSKESTEKRKATFRKIKHQQGKNHSQYGTCWIKKDSASKKIKKEELSRHLEEGWVKGRTIAL